MSNKINITLRIITVLLLILLGVFSIVYDFGDCNVCEFEYEGGTLDTNDFFSLYTNKCFPSTIPFIHDFSSLNLTN